MSEDDFGEKDILTVIDSNQLPDRADLLPRMSLQVPRELIQIFQDTHMGNGSMERVRLVSFIYDNVNGLFPGSLPGRNE